MYPSTRGLEIRAYLTQDNGPSQKVGARLHLYSEPHREWWNHDWLTEWTQDPFGRWGTTIYFTRALRGLPSGRYYIREDYAWLTTAGWMWVTVDFGWVTL